jgi:hypothetical protein
MVYRNTYHIIWYNITIWYGNIAILYCTQLSIKLQYCRLAEDFFLLGISVARGALQTFLPKRPLPPQQKNATAAQPLSACNIAILYGTTFSLLKYTYNTVGLRRISFFSEIRSLRSVTAFFAQTPPPPPTKKCTRGAAPIGL